MHSLSLRPLSESLHLLPHSLHEVNVPGHLRSQHGKAVPLVVHEQRHDCRGLVVDGRR